VKGSWLQKTGVTWLTFAAAVFFCSFRYSRRQRYHGSCQLNFHMVQFWCVLHQKLPLFMADVFCIFFCCTFCLRETLEKWFFFFAFGLLRFECNTFGDGNDSNNNGNSNSIWACPMKNSGYSTAANVSETETESESESDTRIHNR